MGPKGMMRNYNEELHGFNCSSDIVRLIKLRKLSWAGNEARMEEGRSAFKFKQENVQEMRPFGRLWHRWENNVRIHLNVIGVITRNWGDSAEGRDYWRAM